MRWDSVFTYLTVLARRLKLREEHGFPRQPAAAQLGNQVPGSEPPAIASSTERCQSRRRHLLASCSAASIVTSRRSKARVSHATAFGIGHSNETNRPPCERHNDWIGNTSLRNRPRFTRDIRLHCSCPVPQRKNPGWHAKWLGETENGDLKALLKPFPADQMRIWEISPRVNSPENNDPGIIDSIPGNISDWKLAGP